MCSRAARATVRSYSRARSTPLAGPFSPSSTGTGSPWASRVLALAATTAEKRGPQATSPLAAIGLDRNRNTHIRSAQPTAIYAPAPLRRPATATVYIVDRIDPEYCLMPLTSIPASPTAHRPCPCRPLRPRASTRDRRHHATPKNPVGPGLPLTFWSENHGPDPSLVSLLSDVRTDNRRPPLPSLTARVPCDIL
jgi:hypothetical protein